MALPESADYTKLWNDIRESVGLLKSGPLRGAPYTFDHIAGGYDVGLYGCANFPAFSLEYDANEL